MLIWRVIQKWTNRNKTSHLQLTSDIRGIYSINFFQYIFLPSCSFLNLKSPCLGFHQRTSVAGYFWLNMGTFWYKSVLIGCVVYFNWFTFFIDIFIVSWHFDRWIFHTWLECNTFLFFQVSITLFESVIFIYIFVLVNWISLNWKSLFIVLPVWIWAIGAFIEVGINDFNRRLLFNCAECWWCSHCHGG